MLAVLGAGSWGTALAVVLANKNPKQKILLWGRDQALLAQINQQHKNNKYLANIQLPANIIASADLQHVVKKHHDLLLCVPSHAFATLLDTLQPMLTSQHRIAWATKGLDAQSGRFLDYTITNRLPNIHSLAVLSGPSFAMEVAQLLPTAITLAANEVQFGSDLADYLHSNVFRVYNSQDMIGVQLGGVIKNIMAVATGVADGLALGANTRAALITRGLAEMLRLGQALGAKTETLTGLSGLGDLILTCTDNQSRNRRFGLAIGQGVPQNTACQQIGQVVEAMHNVEQICKLATQYEIDMPIAREVQELINGKATPKISMQRLSNRQPNIE